MSKNPRHASTNRGDVPQGWPLMFEKRPITKPALKGFYSSPSCKSDPRHKSQKTTCEREKAAGVGRVLTSVQSQATSRAAPGRPEMGRLIYSPWEGGEFLFRCLVRVSVSGSEICVSTSANLRWPCTDGGTRLNWLLLFHLPPAPLHAWVLDSTVLGYGAGYYMAATTPKCTLEQRYQRTPT